MLFFSFLLGWTQNAYGLENCSPVLVISTVTDDDWLLELGSSSQGNTLAQHLALDSLFI